MIRQTIVFLMMNFALTFFLAGLLASFIELAARRRPLARSDVVETLLRWFLFFSIGLSYLYNGIAHTVFADQSAQFIGWANSPFQLEVGFASFGFALVGFLAFRGPWHSRLGAILGPSCFLLGAAGVHLDQMLTLHDFAAGNAGVVFYADIGLPIIGWVLLYLSRPTAQGVVR